MTKLSANLGFLWPELSLPDAIREAGVAGFDAVECHWPYDYDAQDVKRALADARLTMLGLNTARGSVVDGENGLAAVTGREERARHLIDQACDYARDIECKNIHVMAGYTDKTQAAEDTFRANLKYASEKAAQYGQTVLIEPLNSRDAPGYHLSDIESAISTIDATGCDNIKLMFDCYHIQIMQGDLITRLEASLAYIGHVQIAAVPDRCEPDEGEVNYPEVLRALQKMGYQGFVGAEYKPRSSTEEGLSWMKSFA